MQEREILMDLLGGTKHSINCYTNAIMECSNQQLRSTFQTLRDEAEQMQYQLYQMAEQKGFYNAAPTANQNDIQQIKSSLSSGLNNNMNYAGGGQTNTQNGMSEGNTNSMLNTNMMNTTNATNSISTNTANHNNDNNSNKKSKKK